MKFLFKPIPLSILLIFTFFGKGFANPSTEFKIKKIHEVMSNPNESMAFMTQIMEFSPKEKKEIAKKIIANELDYFHFLSLFLEKSEIFYEGMKIIKNRKDLTYKQLFMIFGTLNEYYYSPDITKYRNEYKEIIKEELKKDKNRQLCITSIEILSLNDLIPNLLIIYKNRDTQFDEKLNILKCFKVLEYKEFKALKEDFRSNILKTKKNHQMEKFSEILNDSEMKIDIDIQLLKSNNPETRLAAAIRLHKNTNQDFGFNPNSDKPTREKIINQWIKWRNSK